MTEDRSLGEFEVVESDAPSNPADFDFAGWLAGFRATRRSVKLYGRADLIGEAERLLADGDTDGASKALDAFEASGVWFTVEQRSAEWVSELRRGMAKAKRWKLDDEDNPVHDDDSVQYHRNREMNLGQLAQQVVSPQVTAEQLAQMAESNENEVAKLLVCVNLANRQLGESAGFLQRLSDTSRASVSS